MMKTTVPDISAKSFHFDDEPQPLSLEDYRESRQKLIRHFSGRPDVLGLYFYGNNSCIPGISDIDALALLKPLTHTRAQDLEKFQEHSSLDQYIFMHGLAHPVTPEILRHIKTFYASSGLEILTETGNIFDILEPEEDARLFSFLSTELEFLPVVLLQLALCLKYRHMPIRRTIKTLSGIRHSIERLNTLGYTDPSWNSLKEDVDILRGEWFRLKDPVRRERLVHLTIAGLKAYQHITDTVKDFMVKSGFLQILDNLPQELFLEMNRNRLVLFSDSQWERQPLSFMGLQALNNTPRGMLEATQWSVIVLPRVMAAYYYIHAGFNTAFGKYLRTKLSPSRMIWISPAGMPFYDAIQRQSEIYAQYWEFLQAYRLSRSASVMIAQFIDDRYRYESMHQFRNYVSRQIMGRITKNIILWKLSKGV